MPAGPIAARLAVVAAFVAFLSGCTSISGSQNSALTTSVATVAEPTYTRDKIIADYAAKRSEEDRVLYRAQIAALFMEAIDENYASFTRRLFTEGVSKNLLVDSTVIGLSTLGSLETKLADDVVPLIAAAAGIGSSVDKNLYFDRTMPALIATMDARRTRMESEILAKLQRSSAEYPVEMLLRDLRRYQDAGVLFRAVVDVTADASANKTEAEADARRQFEKARKFSCVAGDEKDDALGALGSALRGHLNRARGTPPDRDGDLNVRKLAIIVGADPAGSVDEVATRIRDRLDQDLCTSEEIDAVVSRYRLLGGMP